MPLVHSSSPSAFKKNVSTLMHEVGKSKHVNSREQPLAIAFETQRRAKPKRQMGGMAGLSPGWIEKQEAHGMTHTGPIMSAVGGRTDHHPINVPSGSYVLPSAHVSAIGQGNTLNGFAVLNRMFGPPMQIKRGPGAPAARAPALPRALSDVGGGRGQGGPDVPIMAAGGEFVLSPDQVRRVGRGDIEHGHRVLDEWVKSTHKKLAKTAANLPPPAKD